MTTEHRRDDEEIWKPAALAGFEGLYEISNRGLVRITRERSYNYEAGYLLLPNKDKKGYLRVMLT